jgi:hypothetical protein
MYDDDYEEEELEEEEMVEEEDDQVYQAYNPQVHQATIDPIDAKITEISKILDNPKGQIRAALIKHKLDVEKTINYLLESKGNHLISEESGPSVTAYRKGRIIALDEMFNNLVLSAPIPRIGLSSIQNTSLGRPLSASSQDVEMTKNPLTLAALNRSGPLSLKGLTATKVSQPVSQVNLPSISSMSGITKDSKQNDGISLSSLSSFTKKASLNSSSSFSLASLTGAPKTMVEKKDLEQKLPLTEKHPLVPLSSYGQFITERGPTSKLNFVLTISRESKYNPTP